MHASSSTTAGLVVGALLTAACWLGVPGTGELSATAKCGLNSALLGVINNLLGVIVKAADDAGANTPGDPWKADRFLPGDIMLSIDLFNTDRFAKGVPGAPIPPVFRKRRASSKD